jgi:tRNA threonylcarbamoyladenosine biosynthesis protein TsaB
MLILALDTTSLTASAALWRDEVMVAQYFLNSGHTHSTTLLPMIKHMMETSGVSLDDVDLLACAVGPGSFTGIRIGIATLKGLCVGKNIPCVGVSSLEAMAYGVRGVDGIVCPVINARRTQFYSSLFRVKNGQVSRLSEDDIVLGADLDSVLSPYDEAVYLVGDGYGAAREFITHKHLKYTPELYRWPTAFAVADAASHIWNNTSDKSVFTQDSISPVYLRKTQAEREREERISAAQNGDI